MASLSQESSAPSPSSESTLPGMKRGIGIGVVASLTIIIIAVVAYLAIRRRRRLKEKTSQASQDKQQLDMEQQQQQSPLNIINNHDPGTDPQDKKVHQYWSSVPAIEVDAREIHELDGAGTLPELPTRVNVQELEAVPVERSPHQPPPREEDTIATRQSQGTLLKDWAKWSAALASSSPENTSSTPPMPPPPTTASPANESTIPKRSLTASFRNLKKERTSTTESSAWARPRLALLSTQNTSAAKNRMGSVGSLSPLVSGGGATCSSAGVSPMAVSPLSDIYLPPRSQSAGRMA